MSRIRKLVQQLVSQYGTRDPYIIAEKLGIILVYKPYKSTQGYYAQILGQQFIVINSNLSKATQRIVLAHELGHACLHPNYNMAFIEEQTLFPLGYYDSESSIFAAELLLADEIYDKHKDFSVKQLAGMLSVPPILIEIKLNMCQNFPIIT